MIEVFVPRENVNDESVVILAVHFASGTEVKKGDVIVSIETSKTNIDIESEHNGVINHELQVGIEVDVGSLLFAIGGDQITPIKLSANNPVLNDVGGVSLTAKFSQAALRRSQELGVQLNQFTTGWITSADIEKSVGITKPILMMSAAEPVITKNNGPVGLTLPATEMPLSKRKQAEIKNIQMGDQGATTSTIGIKIHVPGERVVQPPYLFKDSISDLIIFEGARLLRQYPELNASYKNDKKWIAYQQINFGWSFDNGKNLKVLAVKNADELSLSHLHEEVERLLNLYESGESIPNDLLLDSTVTFSDLSRSDASYMLPLINGYQSLILGVVKSSPNVFEIFASFDHRVSEGLSVVNGVANISCYACGKHMSEELKLGYRGFVKITLANGQEDNLCRNCFEGW